MVAPMVQVTLTVTGARLWLWVGVWVGVWAGVWAGVCVGVWVGVWVGPQMGAALVLVNPTTHMAVGNEVQPLEILLDDRGNFAIGAGRGAQVGVGGGAQTALFDCSEVSSAAVSSWRTSSVLGSSLRRQPSSALAIEQSSSSPVTETVTGGTRTTASRVTATGGGGGALPRGRSPQQHLRADHSATSTARRTHRARARADYFPVGGGGARSRVWP